MAKQNFESKHPVSLLGELSAKRKFGVPTYDLVLQEGPSHQRQFLYSVCDVFFYLFRFYNLNLLTIFFNFL